MDANLVVIIALVCMNVLQFLAWWWDHHKLIDKVMSRNYAEYVQTKEFAKPKTLVEQVIEEGIKDDPVLDELNRHFSA